MSGKSVAFIYGMVIASGFLLFVVYAVVPEFANLFNGFGAELPVFTRLFIATYQFVVLLPLVLIAPYMVRLATRSIALGSEQALRGYAVRTFLVSVIVVVGCIVAMYLPTWKRGAVIQAG
jgi:type II secretory pathway component PulF